MNAQEQQLYAVFRQVRTCFNQLKTLSEKLHEHLGVNPSMRAVMESLATDGPQTVPDIAKRKGVSRQHIQTIMNALLADQFVESMDNPAHKRSLLFKLTATGSATFQKIQEQEQAPLSQLASTLLLNDLIQTDASLEKINQLLENEISRATTDA